MKKKVYILIFSLIAFALLAYYGSKILTSDKATSNTGENNQLLTTDSSAQSDNSLNNNIVASPGSPTSPKASSSPKTSFPNGSSPDGGSASLVPPSQNSAQDTGQTPRSNPSLDLDGGSFDITLISPAASSIIQLKPVRVSWSVQNTTPKRVAYSLGLWDITASGKRTYYSELNINSSYPTPNFESGMYSWTIPATLIKYQGYTLTEKHKYQLRLHAYLISDGQQPAVLQSVDKIIEFTVDSAAALASPPANILAASLVISEQRGSVAPLSVLITVTNDGVPVPNALVSINMYSDTQNYAINPINTSNDGTVGFTVTVYDMNPINIVINVDSNGKTASASALYYP